MAKAMVVQAPGQLTMAEFPERPLRDGEILLRVCMTGVCGTDRHLLLGHGSWAFPLIAGHEIIGEIVEVTDRAADAIVVFGGELRVGQRVALVPSDRSRPLRLRRSKGDSVAEHFPDDIHRCQWAARWTFSDTPMHRFLP